MWPPTCTPTRAGSEPAAKDSHPGPFRPRADTLPTEPRRPGPGVRFRRLPAWEGHADRSPELAEARLSAQEPSASPSPAISPSGSRRGHEGTEGSQVSSPAVCGRRPARARPALSGVLQPRAPAARTCRRLHPGAGSSRPVGTSVRRCFRKRENTPLPTPNEKLPSCSDPHARIKIDFSEMPARIWWRWQPGCGATWARFSP